MVHRAARGRLFKVESGPYLVGTLYINNAAEAHLLAARRDLDYSPRVSIDEGLERLREYFETGRHSHPGSF